MAMRVPKIIKQRRGVVKVVIAGWLSRLELKPATIMHFASKKHQCVHYGDSLLNARNSIPVVQLPLPTESNCTKTQLGLFDRHPTKEAQSMPSFDIVSNGLQSAAVNTATTKIAEGQTSVELNILDAFYI